jgi:acetyltransferase-like isoleucine patch superfamily enzyme
MMKKYNRGGGTFYRFMSRYWSRFWMNFAGLGPGGRLATRMAILFALPHKARVYLAHMNKKGYVAPSSVIHHSELHLGSHVFMDDRVIIFQRTNGGPVMIGNEVCIYRDSILETGYGGTLTIGDKASIHPRCQINAYLSPIEIGPGVMMAPNCALYPYNHNVLPGRPIRKQPIYSKGGITIGAEAWLGFGVIVLGGVRIGEGAAVGAGSIVTEDIPDGAVAVGAPARVVKMRSELKDSF